MPVTFLFPLLVRLYFFVSLFLCSFVFLSYDHIYFGFPVYTLDSWICNSHIYFFLHESSESDKPMQDKNDSKKTFYTQAETRRQFPTFPACPSLRRHGPVRARQQQASPCHDPSSVLLFLSIHLSELDDVLD